MESDTNWSNQMRSEGVFAQEKGIRLPLWPLNGGFWLDCLGGLGRGIHDIYGH